MQRGMRLGLCLAAWLAAAVFGMSGCNARTSSSDGQGQEQQGQMNQDGHGQKAEAGSGTPDGQSGEDEAGAGTDVAPDMEEAQGPLTIMVATDIHYLAGSLTDGGTAFQELVDYGDGKVVPYISQITDALIQTAISKRPKALILSGDLSLEGEYLSHQELSGRLQAVEQAGIPVLVLPGNHDINNRKAAGYSGDGSYPASYTTPGDFRSIYADYGYDEALYEDPYSLSYIYELDHKTWVMMLDSCQYSPGNEVGGVIRPETYEWMVEKLEEASEREVRVLPVSHHNLLDQSEVYVEDCTVEHGEQVIELLEGWGIPLHLSGHLHVQHYKSSVYDGDKRLYEIVTGSLATPPCLYGVLEIMDSGGMGYPFAYHTERLDMERWAMENHDRTPDLLGFEDFSGPFLKRVFYHQAERNLEKMGLSGAQVERMASYYAMLNVSYYQGKGVDIAREASGEEEYAMWQGDAYGSVLADYVEYMVRDSVCDYNHIQTGGVNE